MQFAEAQVDPPLTAAQGALVAVSLGEGVVGLFESKLPFKEVDKYPMHAMSRPLLIIGMLLVGGWQYVRTRWDLSCGLQPNTDNYPVQQTSTHTCV